MLQLTLLTRPRRYWSEGFGHHCILNQFEWQNPKDLRCWWLRRRQIIGHLHECAYTLVSWKVNGYASCYLWKRYIGVFGVEFDSFWCHNRIAKLCTVPTETLVTKYYGSVLPGPKESLRPKMRTRQPFQNSIAILFISCHMLFCYYINIDLFWI